MADNDDATDDADAKCNGSRNSSISSEEMTAFFGLRVSIITMKMLNMNNTGGTVRMYRCHGEKLARKKRASDCRNGRFAVKVM